VRKGRGLEAWGNYPEAPVLLPLIRAPCRWRSGPCVSGPPGPSRLPASTGSRARADQGRGKIKLFAQPADRTVSLLPVRQATALGPLGRLYDLLVEAPSAGNWWRGAGAGLMLKEFDATVCGDEARVGGWSKNSKKAPAGSLRRFRALWKRGLLSLEWAAWLLKYPLVSNLLKL